MKTAHQDTLLQLSVGNVSVEQLFRLAEAASKAILTIYNDESLWLAQDKADDTPVTAADLKSSNILVEGLPKVLPVPVVSEEEPPPFEQRSQWPVYWLVDPLDGTREFINKTGEFVINIALMHQHQPVFGFIYQVTTGRAWWGGSEVGAFTTTSTTQLAVQQVDSSVRLRALGSRRSRWQGEWRRRLEAAGYDIETESVGSALKFAYLAEGLADLYPRLGPTSEWDTAAPQAILEATGGTIVQWDGKPLEYGKRDTLNPHFVAVRHRSLLDKVL